MKEKEWEKLLRIKTTGRDDTRSDTFRYPYEPTSYEVLERLANTGIIGKNNTLLDYGCGDDFAQTGEWKVLFTKWIKSIGIIS